MSWITVDDGFKKGLDVLNRIDNGKLRLLFNHIIHSLRLGTDNKQVFSSEEKKKLSLSLNVTKSDLDILILTIVTIYQKAAFNLVKPSVMEMTMKENFGLDEEKVAILSQTWAVNAKGIIEAFRQKSTFPNQVSDINWSFDIQSSSMASAKEIQPVVKLQLNFSNSIDSKLTVELDKNNLLDFYHDLEKIQAQLDALK